MTTAMPPQLEQPKLPGAPGPQLLQAIEPEKPKRGRRPATRQPGEVAQQIKDRAKGPGGPTDQLVPIPPVAPIWTAEGVGQIPVGLHNFIFTVYGMAELETEEEKALAIDTAYYLNARWPTGAKYEPEARIFMRLSGLWIPRLVARAKRINEEQAATEQEIAT